MEIRQLETLVAIINHGGFTAASESLGLTQSAVSLQIKSLEDELGLELFDRFTRPPTPTQRAKELANQAREILRLCSDLNEKVASHLTGGLDIGAIPTILTGLLPEALVIMKENQPKLRINVTSGFSEELITQVDHGILSAAIVNEPTELPPGMSWHPFVHEHLVLIVPTGTKGNTDRELLATLPYIRFQRTSWEGRVIDELFKKRNITVNTTMVVDSLEGVSQMVAHGLGVSVVPYRDIQYPFPKGVRIVPLGKKPVKRIIGLIEKIENPKSHIVKSMHQVLVELVKKHSREKKK